MSGCLKTSVRTFSLTHRLSYFSPRSKYSYISLSSLFTSPSRSISSLIQTFLPPTAGNLFIFERYKSKSYSVFSHFNHPCIPMNLSEVLDVLEQLAPLSLAESWDNVGLLVEPSRPRPVQKILLTNDLTTSVMEEAETWSCDLIVSYHPPLFRPIKRLVQRDWKQQLAIRALEAGIAVYSPHTSLDNVRGGVNDWLIGGVGSGSISVLSQALSSTPVSHKLEFTVQNHEELTTVLTELKERGTGILLQYSAARLDNDLYSVNLTCPESMLTSTVQTLSKFAMANKSITIFQANKLPLPGCGQGRRSTLDVPISLATAVQRIKSHLGLSHLRLALGVQHSLESIINTVAVCAGSGGSVLQGVKADLYLTGEMSHHEVLDAVSAGTSVILSDHSNSERGFLSVLREKLLVHLSDSVSVQLSKRDRDPLEIV